MFDEIGILEQHAVDAAISSNWDDAIELNKKIISKDKKNLRAYLRLGFAYIQINKLKDAEEAYIKAQKLQPKNQLAIENLERITILKSRGSKKTQKRDIRLDPSLFLEVPGKTKSIALVKLGQKNTLAHLSGGQKVILAAKKKENRGKN